jgi:hypothetical protein
VVSGVPSHLAKKTTIFFPCVFVGETHVSGKTSISLSVKVLTFIRGVDNIHTSEANETTDATQTRTVKMNATFEQAINAANDLLKSDDAIVSVEIEFSLSTGQVYRGEWDGLNFLSLVKIS